MQKTRKKRSQKKNPKTPSTFTRNQGPTRHSQKKDPIKSKILVALVLNPKKNEVLLKKYQEKYYLPCRDITGNPTSPESYQTVLASILNETGLEDTKEIDTIPHQISLTSETNIYLVRSQYVYGRHHDNYEFLKWRTLADQPLEDLTQSIVSLINASDFLTRTIS